MKSIQAQGKNVQKAIEQGLKELNVSQEEVSIKILDEGGLFRKAKVELVLDKDVEERIEREKPCKKTDEVEKQEKKTGEEKKSVEKKKEKEPEQKEKEESNKTEKIKETKIKVEEIKEEKIAEKEANEKVKSAEEVGKEFLEGLFAKMKVEATVETYKTEVGLTFNASGEKVSNLIGKRGETLNAIQEILTNVIKNAGIKEGKVFFDVENYKNRREISLINLAERMASKAVKINKPIKLEKMSAYERKIIHTAVQNMEGVTSKSEGEEPNRHLIIIPTKKDEEK